MIQLYKSDRGCRKCGSLDINDIFREANFRGPYPKFRQFSNETIERYCQNCKYSWVEYPLDVEISDAHDPRIMTYAPSGESER